MSEIKILIVEDEALVAMEVQIRLRAMGFFVCGICASGETAIEYAERLVPNFILMDIKLKGKLNGIEAADIIKEKFSIPSIYFTALSDENTLNLIKQSRNQEYVLKPLVEDEFKSAIQRLFNSDHIERCE